MHFKWQNYVICEFYLSQAVKDYNSNTGKKLKRTQTDIISYNIIK